MGMELELSWGSAFEMEGRWREYGGDCGGGMIEEGWSWAVWSKNWKLFGSLKASWAPCVSFLSYSSEQEEVGGSQEGHIVGHLGAYMVGQASRGRRRGTAGSGEQSW